MHKDKCEVIFIASSVYIKLYTIFSSHVISHFTNKDHKEKYQDPLKHIPLMLCSCHVTSLFYSDL